VRPFLAFHLLMPVASDTQAEFNARPGHPGADTFGRPAIGARATVTLPDGKTLVDQVDGGSGHAGRSSPQVHFGLGSVAPDQQFDVELSWRNARGQIERRVIRVAPGWHTVVLGSSPMQLSKK
jgi:hypothetical protein